MSDQEPLSGKSSRTATPRHSAILLKVAAVGETFPVSHLATVIRATPSLSASLLWLRIPANFLAWAISIFTRYFIAAIHHRATPDLLNQIHEEAL